MSIKTQKKLMYIPIINVIPFFMWARFYYKYSIPMRLLFQDFIVLSLILFLVMIVRSFVINSFPTIVANNFAAFLANYFTLLVISFYCIKMQEIRSEQ